MRYLLSTQLCAGTEEKEAGSFACCAGFMGGLEGERACLWSAEHILL